MTISITADRMVSNQTQHYAQLTYDAWYVSWCIHLNSLTRNQAITALSLAEAVLYDGIDSPDHQHWPMVLSWCAELGITPEHTIYMLRSIQ